MNYELRPSGPAWRVVNTTTGATIGGDRLTYDQAVRILEALRANVVRRAEGVRYGR